MVHRQHHRRVISYSLRLPPAQAAQLRAELERFRQTLSPWQPEALPEDCFAGRLRRLGGVRFWRVQRGPYATYFIPTINCVSLTNELLEKTDIGRTVMLGSRRRAPISTCLSASIWRKSGRDGPPGL